MAHIQTLIPFIRSFIYSSIHPASGSFIHSFSHPFIHPISGSFIRLFIHPSIQSVVHSFIHFFIHPSSQWFIHSLFYSTFVPDSNNWDDLLNLCLRKFEMLRCFKSVAYVCVVLLRIWRVTAPSRLTGTSMLLRSTRSWWQRKQPMSSSKRGELEAVQLPFCHSI